MDEKSGSSKKPYTAPTVRDVDAKENERRRNGLQNIGVACREVTAGCAHVSQRAIIEYADLKLLEEALGALHQASIQLLDHDGDTQPTGFDPPEPPTC